MTIATQTGRMAEEQIPDSARVLARAFQDDPLTSYWLPYEDHRRKALPWFMGVAAKYSHKHGEVETTAPLSTIHYPLECMKRPAR